MNEQAREPVVGMIVGRSVGDDQIGLKAANEADDPVAVLQTVVEFAIGDVEDLVGGGTMDAAAASASARRRWIRTGPCTV